MFILFFCRHVSVIDLAKQACIFVSIETTGAAAAGKSPLLTTYISTIPIGTGEHYALQRFT